MFTPTPLFCSRIIKVTGDPWLICSIKAGTMATLAPDPNTTLALTLLLVRSSRERITISRQCVSELENLIQDTRVAIMKSHLFIARSDELYNRVWGTKEEQKGSAGRSLCTY